MRHAEPQTGSCLVGRLAGLAPGEDESPVVGDPKQSRTGNASLAGLAPGKDEPPVVGDPRQSRTRTASLAGLRPPRMSRP